MRCEERNTQTTIRLCIQEAHTYDVIVIGGGTTGFAAAIAAARNGVRTALVEYNSFLGGNAANANGLGFLGFHNKQKQSVVRGIALEMVQRLQSLGGASEFYFDPITSDLVAINGNWMKIVMMEMVAESGVNLYLRSLASQVQSRNKTLDAIYIVNKQGCQELRAKAFVDATDTADIAVMSGADYVVGRERDHKVQVSSFCFRVGNLDFKEILDYFSEHPDQIRPFHLEKHVLDDLLKQMHSAPFITGGLTDLVAKAIEDGIDFPNDRLCGCWYPEEREALIVASRVENVDPNNVTEYSQSEKVGQLQVKEIMKFIHNYMPGGKNARLVATGHQIGVRETRHIVGEYELTLEDLLQGKMFNDAIALGAYHVDIHTPDGKGLAPFLPLPTYSIPYRALLPKNVDNLLVAGRCISATHEVEASTRVIPIGMALGEAAGTAAALSARQNTKPKSLNVRHLQEMLVQQGAELGQNI